WLCIRVARCSVLPGRVERRRTAVQRAAAVVAGLDIVQPSAARVCWVAEVGQRARQAGDAHIALIESVWDAGLVGIAESKVGVGNADGCGPYAPIDRFACGGVCGGVGLRYCLSEKYVGIGPFQVDFADVDPFVVEVEFV